MSANIEELLKPRYEVIAKYPNMVFEVGQIISMTHKDKLFHPVTEDKKDEEYWHTDFIQHTNGSAGLYCELFFLEYPAIFKALEWWKYRSKKELPDYLKDEKGVVYQVKEYYYNNQVVDGRNVDLWAERVFSGIPKICIVHCSLYYTQPVMPCI